MEKDNRFSISFFELAFLAEACIAPAPIARSMFFESISEKYYHILTKEERSHLFDWIGRSYSFKHGIESKDEECLLFQARFDPFNQYELEVEYDNDIHVIQAFKYKGRYHTKKDTSIRYEIIKSIIKTPGGTIIG